jgi:hypothetical protein
VGGPTTEPAIDRALAELLGDIDENELAVLTAFLKRTHERLTSPTNRGNASEEAL